jgi:heme oxygenase
VRRGSRAGGALIGSVVSHNLGFTREHGATFLCRYGRETRAVLDTFRAWADGLTLDETGRRESVAAAIATFQAVERWHTRLESEFGRHPAT